MDTFAGIDERYVSEAELAKGILERNKSEFYTTNVELVRENFSEWKNVRIIPGPIPETLESAKPEKVAYLHIDMNCVEPEVAAFDYFWDSLVPGAFVLFDDYAFMGHELQNTALGNAAEGKNSKIVSLPTGQGLLLKPA